MIPSGLILQDLNKKDNAFLLRLYHLPQLWHFLFPQGHYLKHTDNDNGNRLQNHVEHEIKFVHDFYCTWCMDSNRSRFVRLSINCIVLLSTVAHVEVVRSLDQNICL